MPFKFPFLLSLHVQTFLSVMLKSSSKSHQIEMENNICKRQIGNNQKGYAISEHFHF